MRASFRQKSNSEWLVCPRFILGYPYLDMFKPTQNGEHGHVHRSLSGAGVVALHLPHPQKTFWIASALCIMF